MIDLTTAIFNAIIENNVPARRLAKGFAELIEAAEWAERQETIPPVIRAALAHPLRQIKTLLENPEKEGSD